MYDFTVFGSSYSISLYGTLGSSGACAILTQNPRFANHGVFTHFPKTHFRQYNIK